MKLQQLANKRNFSGLAAFDKGSSVTITRNGLTTPTTELKLRLWDLAGKRSSPARAEKGTVSFWELDSEESDADRSGDECNNTICWTH